VDEQTERQINRENKADVACTYRPRDEMPDEKKARKKAVKEERRVCIVRFTNQVTHNGSMCVARVFSRVGV